MTSNPLRRAGLALGLLLGCVYVIVALLGPNGVPALLAERREVLRMQRANADLEKDRDALRLRVQQLKEDQQTQELAIRGTGKAKANEVIIKVDPPKKPATPQTIP